MSESVLTYLLLFGGLFLFITLIILFFFRKRKPLSKKPLPVELYFTDGSTHVIPPDTKEYQTYVALASYMYSGPEKKDMQSRRIIRRYHNENEHLVKQEE